MRVSFNDDDGAYVYAHNNNTQEIILTECKQSVFLVQIKPRNILCWNMTPVKLNIIRTQYLTVAQKIHSNVYSF